MRAPERLTNILAAACLTIATAAAAAAQTAAPAPAKQPYKPTVGMAGKDAVWVPTSEAMIERMLDVAKVTPQDFLMDLGSGDGRAIIAGARRGVRGLGIEFNPDLVEFSKQAAAKAGVADKASFIQGDMYAADISKATVMALFLLPLNLEKLSQKFLDMRPGSRIVANTFWIEGWEPDHTETMQENCDNWCTIHLFIIPAKVAGTWKVDQGDLVLDQTYQKVDGTMTIKGVKSPVKGRLRGDALTLTAGRTEYAGRVVNDRIELTAVPGATRSNGPASLVATRSR